MTTLSSLPIYIKAPLLAFGYFSFAYFGTSLYAAPNGSAYFWPANALVMVMLSFSPLRQWPLLLLSAALCEFAIDRLHLGMPLIACLGLAIANSFEAALAAYLARRLMGSPPKLNSVRQFRNFLFAVVALPPLASALIGVPALRAAGLARNFVSGWWPWWLGDALGTLLVAPALLALAAPRRWTLPAISAERMFEIGLLLALGALSFYTLNQEISGTEATLLHGYLLLPFLAWASVCFGRVASSLALLAVAVTLVWNTGHGMGPFAVAGSSAQALGLQNFLIIAAMTSLGIAAVVAERQHSELFSRKVVEGAPNALLMVNPSGQIVLANPQAERIFGYSREQLLGADIDLLLPAHLKPEHAAHRSAFFRHAEARTMGAGRTLRARRADASEFAVEVGLNPVDTEDGPMVLAAVVDISERTRAEEALRQSEERFELAVRGSTDGIWDWDLRSDSVYRSPRIYEMLGYTIDELPLTMQAIEPLVHPEDRLQRQNALAHTVATGAPFNFEHRLRCKNGEYRWFHGRSRALCDAAGQPYRLAGSLTDISERKAAQVQLEQALADKTVLLQEVHHRVKNNLHVISSLLTLQSRQAQDPSVQAALAESQDRLMAMSLIHQLLYERHSFSHIDLGAYIARLVSLLHESNQRSLKGVELELQLSEVYLDLERAVPCGLIINELVSNAYKHAFPDGRKGKVGVSLTSNRNRGVVLCVRDDGIGLPAALEVLRTRSLGLQLVPLLADQLGARLHVANGPGTRFELQFSV